MIPSAHQPGAMDRDVVDIDRVLRVIWEANRLVNRGNLARAARLLDWAEQHLPSALWTVPCCMCNLRRPPYADCRWLQEVDVRPPYPPAVGLPDPVPMSGFLCSEPCAVRFGQLGEGQWVICRRGVSPAANTLEAS
jgi:hypothetical protein